MYQVVKNIEVPVSVSRRTRTRGAFSAAVDALAVNDGFIFDETRDLKKIYPSVAPKKFPDGQGGFKHFKIWQVSEGKIGVKRVAHVAKAAPAVTEHAEQDE